MVKLAKVGLVGLMLIVALLAVGACSSTDYHSEASDITGTPAVGEVPERISLSQGWDQETRERFWFTSQGSRIIPYSWFTWLEQPNSEELFRSSVHMEMLRYLPSDTSSDNPSGLPIGFVAAHDKKTDEAWVGMTCAACHTNQIDYQGKKLLIDGAPTLANFVLFYQRLVDALNQTQQDDAKFERFARKILRDEYSVNSARELRAMLTSVALAAAERMVVNELPEDFPEDFTSYARLDAFGNIQNAGTAFALNNLSNRNDPTGPVSYPFLWGTHQSDVVQWNASAPNTPVVGPLARNVGEVVGVFGDLVMQEHSRFHWRRLFLGEKIKYTSNVDIEGLGYLESMVKTLQSPVWPVEYLPAIDTVKAAKGRVLFESKCIACHQIVPRENEYKSYTAKQIDIKKVGTDPVTARNADRRCAKTLALQDTKKMVLFGEKLGAESAAITIPVNGSIGVILNHPLTALEAGLRPMRTKVEHTSDVSRPTFTQEHETELDSEVATHDKSIKDYMTEHLQNVDKIRRSSDDQSSCGDPDARLVYKARPLNGIWATAPYLHNGSVPNLWALLQKEDDRPASFWVGSREFDPVNVGFDVAKGLNEFKVNDAKGNERAGNSNRGHDYGTKWTDEQKWAVVEFMKTL